MQVAASPSDTGGKVEARHEPSQAPWSETWSAPQHGRPPRA
ncbi:hypothetical protein ACFPRL_36025 [Pseudoclavibacter helvolus]